MRDTTSTHNHAHCMCSGDTAGNPVCCRCGESERDLLTVVRVDTEPALVGD